MNIIIQKTMIKEIYSMINSESREYVILVSHGSLAYGMKTAIEMICGNDMDIESYDLDHYKSPEEIYVILDNMVKENPDDKFIVFTDLLGGSVHNRLLGLALNEKVIIITGMHLGLVLSMLLDTIGTLEESRKSYRVLITNDCDVYKGQNT